MISKKTSLRAFVPVLALLVTGLMTGCGGGGGGGSTSPITNPIPGPVQSNTATISGVLQDKASGTLLPGRTVTVQGTSLSGTTDSNGAFAIANVPTTTVTLVIVDASGAPNGTYSADISKISGSPRNLGTIQLTVSGGVGSPPGGPVFH